jgi:hypothetical protein
VQRIDGEWEDSAGILRTITAFPSLSWLAVFDAASVTECDLEPLGVASHSCGLKAIVRMVKRIDNLVLS